MEKPDFGDLEDSDGDDGMSETDWHMQQAIEASMKGGDVNPTIDQEMFGNPAHRVPRVSFLPFIDLKAYGLDVCCQGV